MLFRPDIRPKSALSGFLPLIYRIFSSSPMSTIYYLRVSSRSRPVPITVIYKYGIDLLISPGVLVVRFGRVRSNRGRWPSSGTFSSVSWGTIRAVHLAMPRSRPQPPAAASAGHTPPQPIHGGSLQSPPFIPRTRVSRRPSGVGSLRSPPASGTAPSARHCTAWVGL